MRWGFTDYLLDSDLAELCGPDGLVSIEPHPFDLLVHLVRNAERVVTRDELIDVVWQGRVVSDAAVSTVVKQARRAVGDSGAAQSTIRTVHGRGFRFVAPLIAMTAPSVEVSAAVAPVPPASGEPLAPAGSARPSIAVLRFEPMGESRVGLTLTEALPAEFIASLSRLGWLHVIARGSSFLIDPRRVDSVETARLLKVRYLMTGVIEVVGDMMTVSIEISSAADGALLWSERFAAGLADIQSARRDIVAATIAALEIHVPRHEAEQTRRLDAAEFDAWSHYHLGLALVYRFNETDNRRAAEHFETALRLDPRFARAHAGVSFTHWQSAFMRFGDDRQRRLGLACDAATRALELDPQDPFASFNMGRVRWLEGDVDACIAWLDRALQINPNYAQCHYTRGLSLTLAGDGDTGAAAVARALSLSPLDPLQYAMLTAQALACFARDEIEEARRLVNRALQSPGAHFYIAVIGAAIHESGGDRAAARRCLADALARRPGLTRAMYFSAFPFRDAPTRARMAESLGRLGLH